MRTLTLFIFLQVMDLVTTLFWLAKGGEEANPIVLWLVTFAPSLVAGLIRIKVAAVLVGWIMWLFEQKLFLLWSNCVFSLVVTWNLFWLLVWYLNMVFL